MFWLQSKCNKTYKTSKIDAIGTIIAIIVPIAAASGCILLPENGLNAVDIKIK
jgi:hypothetical protein